MASYGIPDNPGLNTTSWLRAWTAHHVFGYKLLKVRQDLRRDWFGRPYFGNTFTLSPTDHTKQ